MKTHSLLSLVFMAVAVHAGVPISRTVDVSATIKPIALEAYAGETLDLSVQLASGGAQLATPSASATIYWQTNGMANAWWQTNMSCSASGLVTGSWSPGLPSGRVWFFVGVESSGLNYRIAGQCAILPSPGGAPSTAVLPPPGGTLNLGDYTIIGAPWITSSDSAAAIASATDPLASEISALSEREASAATSASNYTDSVAAPLIAATNSLTERLDAIDIPDVSGLASKTSLQAASNSLAEAVQQLSSDLTSATNELHTSLAPTISAASTALQPSATNSLLTSLAPTIQLASTALQPSASNALAQATSSLEQTVAYNAQQSGYDLSAVSNALAQAISSLSQTMAYNAQQSGYDLSAVSNALAQAIAALSQTVDYNAQQSGYDLAFTSNALAQSTAALSAEMAELRSATDTQITSATNALNQSLAPTISSTSNALAEATADLAQKVDGLAIITATSNTAFRLMSLDGQIYQDATGTVWHTATAIGTSDWYAVSIQYTNGTTVATNEIPGIPSWSIDGEWKESEGVDYWIWTLRVPAGGSKYASSGGIAEDDSPADMNLQFQLGSGDIAYLDFARTNTVSHYWSPVDHVLYASSSGSDGGLTTNDVCNIVTNEVVVGFTKWEWPEEAGQEVEYELPVWNSESNRWIFVNLSQEDVEEPGASDPNAVELITIFGILRRNEATQNALGLARLVDLPPLTNGILEAIASKASTNDVQLSPVYSQTPTFSEWTILRNDEDVTAQVQQPVYEESDGYWQVFYVAEDEPGPDQFEEPIDINRLTWHDSDDAHNYTATRTRTDIIGYTLGAQTNDFLAALAITNWMASVELLNFVSNALAQSATEYTDSATSSAAQSATNYTDAAISDADTTYTRFSIFAPTNVNQSVQYINITDENPSVLSVVIPEGTGTKDWLIYVTSRTNVTISLPAATWWMADVAYTNDIAPATPTALYFSQIDTGIYLFSRQKLTEVVTQ